MNELIHFVFHKPKKGAGADPKKSPTAPSQILNSAPAPAKKPRLRPAPQHCGLKNQSSSKQTKTDK